MIKLSKEVCIHYFLSCLSMNSKKPCVMFFVRCVCRPGPGAPASVSPDPGSVWWPGWGLPVELGWVKSPASGSDSVSPLSFFQPPSERKDQKERVSESQATHRDERGIVNKLNKLTALAKFSASVLRFCSRSKVSCKTLYSSTANWDTGQKSPH